MRIADSTANKQKNAQTFAEDIVGISLESLNQPQRDAVTYCGDKHCLILAGAGSGKTRVLTHRIAWLISQGARPSSILAITFTNKAAREMRERAMNLISEHAHGVQLSTFHAFGARFLRQYAEFAGLEKTFSIYADNEQKNLVKTAMQQTGILNPSPIEQSDTDKKNENATVNSYLDQVISWKERGTSVQDAQKQAKTREQESMALVYQKYEQLLIANNAVDFAGLLLWPLYILNHVADVKSYIQRKYQYILVDEFQDTNGVQLDLIQALCGPDTQLTVVGDDDQSIYTWRGADPSAILKFEQRYGACEVFKLEQNYRSTKPILTCAGNLIACNRVRTEKRLWTDREGGEPVHIVSYDNDWDEAGGVLESIQKLARSKHISLQQFAVLYRKNSQSVSFERECTRKNIPYQVIGAVGFFEREEIADLMCYLRILVNPTDTMALRRIINKPVRGIGEKSCEKILEFIEKKAAFNKTKSECLRSVLEDIILEKCKIPRAGTKVIEGCKQFLNMLERVENWPERAPHDILNDIISETGYLTYIRKAAEKKGQEFNEVEDRIKSLFETLRSYNDEHPNDLPGFLEEMALVRPESDDQKAAVNLMTIHSAKGLEFDVVYIVGAEQGILPLDRGGCCDLEEERRLMYVAMTRAKKILYISHAEQRHEYGRLSAQSSSNFLDEMVDNNSRNCVDYITAQPRDFGYSGSGNPKLSWSSGRTTTRKPSAASKDDNPFYDLAPAGGIKRKPAQSQDDFEPDYSYDDDAFDIFDDVIQKSKQSNKSQRAFGNSANPPSRSESIDALPKSVVEKSRQIVSAVGKNNKKMQVGTAVEHAIHGKGVVIKLEASGNDYKATVSFNKSGQRTIIARFLTVL